MGGRSGPGGAIETGIGPMPGAGRAGATVVLGALLSAVAASRRVARGRAYAQLALGGPMAQVSKGGDSRPIPAPVGMVEPADVEPADVEPADVEPADVEPADVEGVVELPADGRAAGMARRLVRRRLQDWNLDELVDTVTLLTSEAIANVIVHTATAPALSLVRVGGGVRVSVLDGSPAPPQHRRHSATATTGRGLELIHDLAADWGWEPVGVGKAVWFVVRGDRRPGTGRAADDRPPAPPTTASPLGRYGATGTPPGPTVRVELLGLPVRVLAAGREHHDGLMREFRLLALDRSAGARGGPTPTQDMPGRLVELTQALGVQYAAARSRPDAAIDAALDRGLDTVDLVYQVPPAVIDSARDLDALMTEADEFCRSARLMTLPRTPTMTRFATWYLDQIADQIAGRPPTRWDGPLDPD